MPQSIPSIKGGGPKKWGTYDKTNKESFRLSRSKIDLFLNCARCFYLDRRYGIKRPDFPPYTLNNAVDTLLKREFDHYRKVGLPHPLFKIFHIDAVPFQHERMDEWRDALKRGVTYVHPDTNFRITGGVDDVWVKPNGELVIADYKATAKDAEITINSEWQIAYKRQMEVYQWLFRKNGFAVSDIGYFVYANGDVTKDRFDQTLHFAIKCISYQGNTDWIEDVLPTIKHVLDSDDIPEQGKPCAYCDYRNNSATHESTGPNSFATSPSLPTNEIRKSSPLPHKKIIADQERLFGS